jgi:hypothetical protein
MEEHAFNASDSSSPLLDINVLQNVLSFVGPGHYLFVALVSHWWSDMYTLLMYEQLEVELA